MSPPGRVAIWAKENEFDDVLCIKHGASFSFAQIAGIVF